MYWSTVNKCECYKFLARINILLKIHLIVTPNRTCFRLFLQNAAGRLARLVNAIKASIWRKAASVSSLSNSSGSFAGNGGGGGGQTAGVNRGSRDAATAAAPTAAAVQTDDGLDRDPLDEAASAAAAASKKRSPDEASSIAGAKGAGGQ